MKNNTMTPHTYRRNKWTFIVIGGFIAIMAIGLFSCKKEIGPIDEPNTEITA
jgi:hypothetical protein